MVYVDVVVCRVDLPFGLYFMLFQSDPLEFLLQNLLREGDHGLEMT